MSNQIRWGVLSTANIGAKRVIPAIHNSHNGIVTAVASRNHDRAKAFADTNNIPRAYGTYDDLLADDSVDAIYIPLPNSHHAEWAIKCAEAGKPTLCEKPLAATADEAQTMVDAFKERGILFAEAFMYRFHPQTQRVKAMVEAGEIGDIGMMSATFSFQIRDGNEDNIRLQADLAGGALMDVGCYCINAMRYMIGEEPTRGTAYADFGSNGGVDETVAAILEFPSGAIGHLDASLRLSHTHTYEIRGSKGRIQVPTSFVPNYQTGEPTQIYHWHDNTMDAIDIPASDHYQIMVEDFADALINNRPPKFDPQDGVENMRVIDMLLASAR